MRICMLTSAPFPPKEGIGFYVWNLSRYLQRAGHSVQVITRGTLNATFREEYAGIPIWKASFAPLYPFHVHLHSIFVDRLLRRLAPEIELLHAHTPLVRLPTVKFPTLVTAHTSMRADIRAIKFTSAFELMMKLQAPVSYALEGELLFKSNHVVAVSSSVAGELRPNNEGLGMVKVLGNGVDTEVFQPAEVGSQPVKPCILAAGRLAPGKGWKDLIDAARLVVREQPSSRFYIAGCGPLEKSLRRYIQAQQLASNVFLLGHVSDRVQLAELYRGAAVFVHPALHEGLPTVLLEAMACGRPVVATAVSGALDVIEHGRNGFLVPPSDPIQMAESIMTCLSDPEMSREVGVCARKTIEARYSWQVVSGSYIDEYEQLLQDYRN